jgi:hypothetical protein
VIEEKVLDQWRVDATYMLEQVKKVKEDPNLEPVKTVMELLQVLMARQIVLIEELSDIAKAEPKPKRIVDL